MDRYIAGLRFSTPGVTLISPPPHHDIYSIEDLKQLIYDLRCANPRARVSVKLVSEVGVGTIAAGVAKANADHVVIAGHDGGTGASPQASIQHAGIPWEIGLAETQQTLLRNDLRSRILVEVDGQMRTGRDVVIGAILGADEFGFSTAPLIALGCVMMRVCHLNTCPVGVATQDPELRKRFEGKPEHVVNYLFMVAEEARGLMASLGVRSVEELIGRTDLLAADEAVDHWKARGIDLRPLLEVPDNGAREGPALAGSARPSRCSGTRSTWTSSSSAARRSRRDARSGPSGRSRTRTARWAACSPARSRAGAAPAGLAEGSVEILLRGSAGQSFGAWLANGVSLVLEGDANDYVGKGLSGGSLVVRPPEAAGFAAEENVIVGNVVLYGATSGRAFFRGLAGERFAVRNSGAVSRGGGRGRPRLRVHDRRAGRGARRHGPQLRGRHERRDRLRARPGRRLPLALQHRARGLRRDHAATTRRSSAALVQEHLDRTGSPVAAGLLERWDASVDRFVKVMPHDYKRALAELEEPEPEQQPEPAMAPARRRERLTMGDPKGFLRIERAGFEKRDPKERVHDYGQYFSLPDDATLREQGGRCMDCGVPFCHEGCPLGNRIPDWNDLVYRDRWQDALTQLHATNNFPEFTGLICPAPCESACVLDINDDPVTIEQIELAIADRGFQEGWIDAEPPDRAHRQDGGRGGLRAGRAGGGRPAEQARPQGHGLRARRGARRPAALRSSGREAREVDHRPPRGPAREGGHRLRLRHGRGRRRGGRGAPPPARRRGGGDRLARAPRPRDARPRAGQRALRDGLPLPAQPLGGASRRAGRRATRRRRPPSAPRAGAWWWWAAATPAWTACRTPCARARRAC